MYAVVKDNIVIGSCFEPDKEKFESDNLLVEMTLENSPAYLNGAYINNKFYPPENN
jgi:hypothetical protein